MSKLLTAFLLLLAASAHADLTDEFRARARSEYLKPFALDLGGILGAATVDPGASLGFPGFEAGVVSAVQFRPDRDDRILRDAGVNAFGAPLAQVAVGLPANISLVGHGMRYQGVTVYGGGLRYSVFKPGLVSKLLPSIGAAVFADKLDSDVFSAVHYAANVSAGLALPLITPFAAVGWDLTKVEVEAAAAAGLAGQSAWARGTRLALGADLTPFPFVRLRAAYQLLHGLPGMTADLLFKF